MDLVIVHMHVENVFVLVNTQRQDISANLVNRVKSAIANAFSTPALATAVA